MMIEATPLLAGLYQSPSEDDGKFSILRALYIENRNAESDGTRTRGLLRDRQAF
jgi:hypothetical protein